MCYHDEDRKPLSREEWREIWGDIALLVFTVAAILLTLAVAGPVGRNQ